jgi:hypothetical protein
MNIKGNKLKINDPGKPSLSCDIDPMKHKATILTKPRFKTFLDDSNAKTKKEK